MADFKLLFLSGTSDASDVFNLVKDGLPLLGIEAIRMPFEAQPLSPARASLRELSKCQAVVLLIDKRYGTPRPEIENRSITELEFDEAYARKIPIFCFIGRDALGREKQTIDFVQKIRDLASEYIYNDSVDFADLHGTAKTISATLSKFRWLPKDFSSFGEWGNLLLAREQKLPGRLAEEPSLPTPIGRKAERERLTAWFSEAKNQTGAVIAAMPGYGKTMVAYHFARQLLEQDRVGHPDVLIIPSGQSISLESVREITPNPNTATPVLIIMDDADERPDLKNIIRLLANSPHIGRMRILLTVQGNSVPNIFRELYPFFSDSNSVVIQLPRLNLVELQEYAASKNMAAPEQGLQTVLRNTSGIPIYVDLFFRGVFTLSNMGTAKQMRDHFVHYVLGEFLSPSNARALAVTKALALLDTTSPQDPDLSIVLAKLGHAGDFGLEIELLKTQGVIYVVGSKIRLHNRIVQDFVIANYWTHRPDKEALLPLLSDLGGKSSAVIQNLARAEWAIKAAGADPAAEAAFEDVWMALEVDFNNTADHGKRVRILEVLGEAAFYLPALGARILEKALELHRKGGMVSTGSYDHELDLVGDLGYAVAFAPAFSKSALNALWEFGKHDGRKLNPHPSHPIRKLQSLAEFTPGRTFDRYRELLDRARAWSEATLEETATWSYSPLDFVDEFFKNEWESAYSYQNVYRVQRGPLPFSREIERLKLDAIDLVGEYLQGQHGSKFIRPAGQLISRATPLFQPKEWTKVGSAGLTKISETFTHFAKQRHWTKAFVIFLILRDLRNRCELTKTEIPEIVGAYDTAKSEFEAAEPSLFQLLQLFIVSGTETEFEPALDISHVRQQLIQRGVASTIEWLDSLALELEELDVYGGYGPMANWDPISEEWMKFSADLVIPILRQARSARLVGIAPGLLWGARVAATSQENMKSIYMAAMLALTEALENTEIPERTHHLILDGCKRLILGLLKNQSPLPLFPEETQLVARWKQQPDFVWAHIISTLAKSDLARAKELLLSAEIGADERAAEEVCSAILHGSGMFDAFDESEWRRLLDKFVPLPDCKEYSLDQVIIRCGNKYPELVAQFLETRIAQYESLREQGTQYHALPVLASHHLGGVFSQTPVETRISMLNQAIDRMKAEEVGTMSHAYYAELTELIIGGVTNPVVQALMERSNTRDASELITVAEVVQHLGEEFVFQYPELIDQLLTNAAANSKEMESRVGSELFSGAWSGSYTRSVGQDSPKHVVMEEKAEKIKRKFSIDSPTYKFYASLGQNCRSEINRQRAEDAETLDS